VEEKHGHLVYFDRIRFVRYKPTSLEKNYRWDLLTEHDVGVEIDLINPEAYASSGTAALRISKYRFLFPV
jgi:hypothetical protein